jgi:hypothetical protein
MLPATIEHSPVRRWTTDAFGLSVSGAFAAPGLDHGRAGDSGARGVRVSLGNCETRSRDTERIFEQRAGDAAPVMTIDRLAAAGSFRIAAPGYGRFDVSEDGRRVVCAPERNPDWRWQRYLIGQALPLASILQGLETFHASAVVSQRGAIAFVGASTTGKTTVALHAVLAGARFLCDDVLVLEPADGVLLAHPGPRVASVRHATGDAVGPRRLRELGAQLGADDEEIRVRVRDSTPAVPLAVFALLERVATPGPLAIERVRRPDPRMLLSASFNFLIADPARLVRQLDTCAAVAKTARIYRIRVPAGIGPEWVARSALALAEGRR